jgi:hypothetical protein
LKFVCFWRERKGYSPKIVPTTKKKTNKTRAGTVNPDTERNKMGCAESSASKSASSEPVKTSTIQVKTVFPKSGKKSKYEETIDCDKVEPFKDMNTGVFSIIWRFTTKACDVKFSFGEESIYFDAFELELQHKDSKILGVTIRTEDPSIALIKQIKGMWDPSWKDFDMALERAVRISKLDLTVKPQIVAELSAKSTINWTDNIFDLPDEEELWYLWNFTTEGGAKIISNLQTSYQMSRILVITKDNQFVEFAMHPTES